MQVSALGESSPETHPRSWRARHTTGFPLTTIARARRSSATSSVVVETRPIFRVRSHPIRHPPLQRARALAVRASTKQRELDGARCRVRGRAAKQHRAHARRVRKQLTRKPDVGSRHRRVREHGANAGSGHTGAEQGARHAHRGADADLLDR